MRTDSPDPHARPSALAQPLRGALIALTLLPGCIGYRIVNPVMPNEQELLAFEQAGPIKPEVDTEQLAALFVGSGTYTTVSGDLLGIELPRTLTGGDSESGESVETIRSRVSAQGTIRLPMLGDVQVTGKTMAEIEAITVARYHPEFVEVKPNVVVTVVEHRTVSVAVLGAVANPGRHELRSDRLSLLGALMAAGGISEERGAGMIRIQGPDIEGSVMLPVRAATIPFEDVALRGGETIIAEPLSEENFTVIGLVSRPGAFPYPHAKRYNLMQALATAGGVDATAAPRFATVYRQKTNGDIVGATFKIDGTSQTDASNIVIKPGDVISVDHTQGSWTRQFISQVFGFRASFSSTGSLL